MSMISRRNDVLRKRRAFLDSLDKPARAAVRRRRGIEAVLVVAALGSGILIGFTDSLRPITLFLYNRPAMENRFFITTESMVVTVPLIIGLLFLVGMLLEAVEPKVLGQYRDIWREYRSMSVYGSKIYNRIAEIMGVVSVVIVILSVSSYVRVTDDGIGINRFFGLGERFHKWDSVSEIRKEQWWRSCNRCGGSHQMHRYQVTFSDSSNWTTWDSSFEESMRITDKAVQFISRRSVRHIQIVER